MYFWSCFNPYFTGLPILIIISEYALSYLTERFNPYFTGLPILIFFMCYRTILKLLVSILILLDYLFLSMKESILAKIPLGFNPYFTGLPILMI